jgi:methylated-DNA-[protein]-cysteine S-methyltransferase
LIGKKVIVELKKNSIRVRKMTFSDLSEITYALLQLVHEGDIITYKALANFLRTNVFIIVRALKNNPNPIAVPCHRVIKSNNEIGGYTLYGKRADNFKRALLKHEGVIIKDGKVASDRIIKDMRGYIIDDP